MVVASKKNYGSDSCIRNWMDSYWYLYGGQTSAKQANIHIYTMDKSSTVADISECYKRCEPTLLCAIDQEKCSAAKSMLQTYSSSQQAS